jgi:hypothetical protein
MGGSIQPQVTTSSRNNLRLFRVPGHKLGHKARSIQEELFSNLCHPRTQAEEPSQTYRACSDASWVTNRCN